MKLIIILVAVLTIVSCKDDVKVIVAKPVVAMMPYAVQDSCVNLWAVRTTNSIRTYQYAPTDTVKLFFGKSFRRNVFDTEHDSVDDAELGHEYQFEDSPRAMKVYYGYKKREQDIERANQRLLVEQKRQADSAFKCRHSYKEPIK